VVFDSNLTFTPHIAKVVAKAKQKLFLLFRCFGTKDIDSLINGYKYYVLPVLEYGSPIWSTIKVSDIEAIESVQRKFTKKIKGKKDMPYWDRLTSLGLQSLELRRLKADLLLCFNSLQGLNYLNHSDIGIRLNSNRTRGHKYKLIVDRFFGNRVIRAWNSLPPEVAEAISPAAFKIGISKINLSDFTICL